MDRGKDVYSHLKGKVNLYNFLLEHSSFHDFEMGWFLHLVTDYLFFQECFDVTYLQNIAYDEFCKNLYFAYDCLNSYIALKYDITKDYYVNYPDEYYSGIPYQNCFLSKEQIDAFIERVSSIDLEAYILKLKTYKKM